MKLYRFPWSGYARKVQMVLDLLQRPAAVVDVPYCDRTELATLTGGYIYVPVLVDDGGRLRDRPRTMPHHIPLRHGPATRRKRDFAEYRPSFLEEGHRCRQRSPGQTDGRAAVGRRRGGAWW
jgi:hypothetical protein